MPTAIVVMLCLGAEVGSENRKENRVATKWKNRIVLKD